MQPMSYDEIVAQITKVESADPNDFISVGEDGIEYIDTAKVMANSSVLKAVEIREGKVISIGLANGKRVRSHEYLYLIRAENGLIKIGYSEDVQRRYSLLNTASPIALELLWFMESARARLIEAELHQRFASKRVRGEWFAIGDEDVESIRQDYGGETN